MVFGWGRDPDPDPARAKEASDRCEHALELLERGERDKAIDALSKAAEVGAEAYTPDGYRARAEASLALGRAHRDDEAHEAAIEAFRAAVDAGAEGQTPESLTMAAEATLELAELLDAHDALAEGPEASSPIDVLERGVHLARGSQATEGLIAGARAAYRLSQLVDEAEGSQPALDRAREAFELAQQADTDEGDHLAALASLSAARLLGDQARTEEALEALERSMALAETLDAPGASEVRAHGHLLEGTLRRDVGETQAAIASFEAAVDAGAGTTRQGADRAARAAWALADLHADSGDLDTADDWYETASQHALDAGDPEGAETAARIALARGSRHHEAGHEAAASDGYADATRFADRAGTSKAADIARLARSRNVKLASGLQETFEIPTSPPPGDPPEMATPGEEPEAPLEDAAAEPPEEDPMPDAATNGTETPPTPDEAPEPPSEDHRAPPAPGTTTEGAATGSADDAADTPDEDPPSPRTRAPEGPRARGALVDRAETLHELGLKRGNEAHVEQAIGMIEAALEEAPHDADLLHRRARMRSTLAVRRGDQAGLEDALDSFDAAFDQHGGRVDPTTHQPGPKFFFDWGRATYELAEMRQDADLFEAAHERLSTGYEMTPRGARHLVAAALMARCLFGRATVEDDASSYEQVLEQYEALEIEGPFALAGEDYALWARALAWLADARDDASLYKDAYERMQQARERA